MLIIYEKKAFLKYVITKIRVTLQNLITKHNTENVILANLKCFLCSISKH